jgi:hypothetical protein
VKSKERLPCIRHRSWAIADGFNSEQDPFCIFCKKINQKERLDTYAMIEKYGILRVRSIVSVDYFLFKDHILQ